MKPGQYDYDYDMIYKVPIVSVIIYTWHKKTFWDKYIYGNCLCTSIRTLFLYSGNKKWHKYRHRQQAGSTHQCCVGALHNKVVMWLVALQIKQNNSRTDFLQVNWIAKIRLQWIQKQFKDKMIRDACGTCMSAAECWQSGLLLSAIQLAVMLTSICSLLADEYHKIK